MKNIHVLPTNQSSRLYYHSALKQLVLTNKTISREVVTNQNIYITSDKEIKKEDWFIHSSHGITNIFKAKSVVPESIITECGNGCWVQYCKKIILTTDQDLIKDGVQAIDDDFLEWFVKNPSCEEVEIKEHWAFYPLGLGKKLIAYEIIITKEESKQVGIDWSKFPKSTQEKVGYVESKQETLEEAAERINYFLLDARTPFNNGFKEGAKWQQERSFNEEEIRKVFEAGKEYWKTSGDSITCDELIEQFKKK